MLRLSLIQNWTGGRGRGGSRAWQMLLYDLGQATEISLSGEKEMKRYMLLICESSPRLVRDFTPIDRDDFLMVFGLFHFQQ